MVMVMMVVLAATMMGTGMRGIGVQAQLDCASKLIPCQDAISNVLVKPGKACCSALADAVKNELKCLCDVYSSDSVFQSLNINKTRALEIPGLCGVSSDLSRCNSGMVSNPQLCFLPSLVLLEILLEKMKLLSLFADC